RTRGGHLGASASVLRLLPPISASQYVSALGLEERSQASLRFLRQILFAAAGFSVFGKCGLVLRKSRPANAPDTCAHGVLAVTAHAVRAPRLPRAGRAGFTGDQPCQPGSPLQRPPPRRAGL